MKFIPYGKQWIDQDDIDAVISALKSDYLTQGPEVRKFEKALAEKVGVKYCVAVANGTAALHLAVAVLQLPEGSSGITSPITFAASANAMVYSGVTPRFADIDLETYTISPEDINASIETSTKLLLPVHFAGQPADMAAIYRIASANDYRIIEDAAHAIGSTYENGEQVGSCCYSDMTIFSFHPVKTFTTGEGGAITTNNPELYEKLSLLRTHGITKDPTRLHQNPGPWYYEMQDLGYNYRLTDMQAALGVTQLSRLEEFKKRRRAIVEWYNRTFSGIDWITIPKERNGVDSCFHLYVVKIDFSFLKMDRKAVIEILHKQGIGTQVHYIPVHLQPYYTQRYGYKEGDFPAAEKYYAWALSLPLYPAMHDKDVERVIEAIKALKK